MEAAWVLTRKDNEDTNPNKKGKEKPLVAVEEQAMRVGDWWEQAMRVGDQ